MSKWVDKSELVDRFGISEATLRNWVKNAIPTAVKQDQNGKELYSLLDFEQYIEQAAKLQKRANKKRSTEWRPPVSLLEYLQGHQYSDALKLTCSDFPWVEQWMLFIQKNFKENSSKKLTLEQGLVDVLRARVHQTDISPEWLEIAAIVPHPEEDLYATAVAYQCVLNEGARSESGSYFTPKSIVVDLLKDVVHKNGRFLEPCCGTGFIALEYLQSYFSLYNTYPEQIFLNDIDSNAVQISSLLCQFLTHNATKVVATDLDGTQLPYTDMTLVVTNPPYGIKCTYKNLKTTEIFSHMLHSAVGYCQTEGRVRFVLPESILSVERHNEIRSWINTQTTIQRITHYGQAFDGVASHIVVLDLLNTKTAVQSFEFVENLAQTTVSFDTQQAPTVWSAVDKAATQWLKKVLKHPHITLEKETFALGIVTGNNKQFVFDTTHPNREVVLGGKNIERGVVQKKPQQYLETSDFSRFQQKPPISVFNGPKIVYRFICKDLVTAVDNSNTKTLNSANIIQLNHTQLAPEYVSALLNSSVLNKIYKLKFGNPLKVLKAALQTLPIFVFDDDTQGLIVNNYKAGLHDANDTLIEKLLHSFIRNSK